MVKLEVILEDDFLRRDNVVIGFKDRVVELISQKGTVRISFQKVEVGRRLMGVRMIRTTEGEEDMRECHCRRHWEVGRV